MDPIANQSEPEEVKPSASQSEASASEKPAPAHADSPGDRRPWLGVLAAALTIGSLFGPIASSGIWDPHELGVADLARRIALNLLGAEHLALQGGVNTVPTLGDLSRGQLPF